MSTTEGVRWGFRLVLVSLGLVILVGALLVGFLKTSNAWHPPAPSPSFTPIQLPTI